MLKDSLIIAAIYAGLGLARPAVNSAGVPDNLPSNETQLYPPYTYKSSYNYIPDGQGIPIVSPNTTITPWDPIVRPNTHTRNVKRSCSPLTPTYPSTFWYEVIDHNGESPFIANGASWEVFRNVKTAYGAAGDGVTDDTAALQNAITAGNSAGNRAAHVFGTTGQPAVVYLPEGEYLISSPLQLYVGTVIIGNPLSPPTIKASAGFSGDFLIYGKDPNLGSTINFYIAMKNLVLDSTNIAASTTFTLLDWSVSQATQLTNLVFNMPDYSTGHTGISMPEGGSGTMIGDLTFNGGAVGINMSNQQYNLKNIAFVGCTTGIQVSGCFQCTFQSLSFKYNNVGIEYTNSGLGVLIVIDSTATDTGTFVAATAESTGANSLVIENFVDGGGVTNTVTASGTTILTGSVSETWVYGNAYVPGGPTTGSHQTGTTYSSGRVSTLLNSAGQYQTIPPPTYDTYDVTEFINVKDVSGYPVYGDGATDDTANLNYIASTYAGCNILFFPAGTYIVTNTLFFPSGSRVVGEVWSAISATGSNFYNPSAPVPMVKVGNAGDVGVAQFTDMLFTVADVLQGATLVEVNIAGSSPGAVGFWNSHFRVGGAAGSKVETNCGGSGGGGTPAQCKAAYLLIHLTSTSSAYIEDMWGWTADHDLDGDNTQTISTGRGILVEATAGTWLVGTAFEHNTLYQYNLNNAQNVYIGMQQSETPYWQGTGSPSLAPAPWTAAGSDPNFSNCGGSDAQCRMAWFQAISGSSDIFIYGSGFWTFFNDNSQSCGSSCQTNAVNIESSSTIYYYGLETRSNINLVYYDGSALVTQNNNPGGWGGDVAAFLWDS